MRGATHSDMRGIKTLLEVQMDGKKGIRSKNKDRVSCIGGYEGMGKSTLLLNMFTFWNQELLKKPVTADMIEYIADNKERFVVALKKAQRFEMPAHDEAVQDLYSRNAMGSFNKKLNQAYFIIRGKNLHTVLVLPSILDLDSNFRKRRVTTYYHVYSEGKVAVYLTKTLSVLLPVLQKMAEKNVNPDPLKAKDTFGNLIVPDFLDTFPLYKGVLLEPYLARKEDNMDQVIDDLDDSPAKKVVTEKAEDVVYPLAVKDLMEGLSQAKIAKKYNVSCKVISKVNMRYLKGLHLNG